MNRTDSILSVYSDARSEYTKQLCVYLVPAYFQFFINLLEKAKQATVAEPKKALWQFQNFLNDIHDWNMEKVNNEIQQINNNCGCDYLEDLLTAVFIAHTKVLTAIRLSSNQKKVQITVPKVEHFLFKVLCESAKLLWGTTYLFRDGISSVEKQQNYRNIEQILNDGIHQAIRSLVPVKSILKDFMNNDGDDEGGESDEEETEKQAAPIQVSEPVKEEPKEVIEEKVSDAAPLDTDIKPIEETSQVVQEENKSIEETTQPVNEIIIPDIQQPPQEQSVTQPISSETPVQQMIIIDDEQKNVRFGDFNAIFDHDNPEDSDMILDSTEDDTPDLEILEENGVPLGDEDLDAIDSGNSENIGADDYEVLV